MPNDTARLLATVSALGLSLGVTFDSAAAAPAAGEVAAPLPDAAARTAGYDLKSAKKLRDDPATAAKSAAGVPDEKKLVAVKTISWARDDDKSAAGSSGDPVAADVKGSVTQKIREMPTKDPK